MSSSTTIIAFGPRLVIVLKFKDDLLKFQNFLFFCEVTQNLIISAHSNSIAKLQTYIKSKLSIDEFSNKGIDSLIKYDQVSAVYIKKYKILFFELFCTENLTLNMYPKNPLQRHLKGMV